MPEVNTVSQCRATLYTDTGLLWICPQKALAREENRYLRDQGQDEQRRDVR